MAREEKDKAAINPGSAFGETHAKEANPECSLSPTDRMAILSRLKEEIRPLLYFMDSTVMDYHEYSMILRRSDMEISIKANESDTVRNFRHTMYIVSKSVNGNVTEEKYLTYGGVVDFIAQNKYASWES